MNQSGSRAENGDSAPRWPAPATEGAFDELLERARSRSRLSMRARLDRLQAKSWHVGQCAVAAGVAWFLATNVLHHPQALFAPIVAVICLGMTYGQRLRRVAEVTIGVAIGVAIADVFVRLAGSGAWQITVVVLASMSVALVLDAGQLLVMQSAVQSIAVTALAGGDSQAFTRWLDALVGGSVALVAAAVVPRAPLRQPRVRAARVTESISQLLRDAADSGGRVDVERAAQVLAAARGSEGLIRELQTAADEGMSVIASTPWRRREARSVRSIASVVEPLERTLSSTRVLVRRVSIAADQGRAIPPAYASVLRGLADAVDIIGSAWAQNRSAENARPPLVAVGQRTRLLQRDEYHTTIVLGQLRSLVVDALELTGLEHDEAVREVPPLEL